MLDSVFIFKTPYILYLECAVGWGEGLAILTYTGVLPKRVPLTIQDRPFFVNFFSFYFLYGEVKKKYIGSWHHSKERLQMSNIVKF